MYERFQILRREKQEIENDYWHSYYDAIQEEQFSDAINQVDEENAHMDLVIDNYFTQMSNINNNLILIINNSRFLKCLFMIEYRQFFTKFIIMSNTINQHTVKCLKCNIDLQFKKPSLE